MKTMINNKSLSKIGYTKRIKRCGVVLTNQFSIKSLLENPYKLQQNKLRLSNGRCGVGDRATLIFQKATPVPFPNFVCQLFGLN